MKQLVVVALLVGSGAVLACSSAPRASSRADCNLSSSDSTFLAAGAVYRDCAVDVRARQISTPMEPMNFQPTSIPSDGCFVVELEFVVDARGIPEADAARVTRSSSTQFADAVLTSLPKWRYSPAQKDGEPVRQIVRERLPIMVAFTVSRAGSTSPPRAPASNCN